MENASSDIKNIYEACSNANIEQRLTINEIVSRLDNIILSYLINESISPEINAEFNNFIYEVFVFQIQNRDIVRNLTLSHFVNIEYNTILAKQNNSDAFYQLGMFYEEYKGINHDYYEANLYYALDAEQNNSNALYKLGYFNEYGKGVEKEFLTEKEYYKIFEKTNYIDSLFNFEYLCDIYKEDETKFFELQEIHVLLSIKKIHMIIHY